MSSCSMVFHRLAASTTKLWASCEIGRVSLRYWWQNLTTYLSDMLLRLQERIKTDHRSPLLWTHLRGFDYKNWFTVCRWLRNLRRLCHQNCGKLQDLVPFPQLCKLSTVLHASLLCLFVWVTLHSVPVFSSRLGYLVCVVWSVRWLFPAYK